MNFSYIFFTNQLALYFLVFSEFGNNNIWKNRFNILENWSLIAHWNPMQLMCINHLINQHFFACVIFILAFDIEHEPNMIPLIVLLFGQFLLQQPGIDCQRHQPHPVHQHLVRNYTRVLIQVYLLDRHRGDLSDHDPTQGVGWIIRVRVPIEASIPITSITHSSWVRDWISIFISSISCDMHLSCCPYILSIPIP